MTHISGYAATLGLTIDPPRRLFRTIRDDNEAGESCNLRDQLRTALERAQTLMQRASNDPLLSEWSENYTGEIDTVLQNLPTDDAIDATAAQKARDRAEDEAYGRADWARDLRGDR